MIIHCISSFPVTLNFSHVDLIHSLSVLLSTYCTYLGYTFTHKVVSATLCSRDSHQHYPLLPHLITSSPHHLITHTHSPTHTHTHAHCQIHPIFERSLCLPKQNVSSALAEGQSYITSPVLPLYVAGVLAAFPKVGTQSYISCMYIYTANISTYCMSTH